MPLILPTVTLEKLKKFPSQALIAILLILLGYFINGGNRTDKELKESYLHRAQYAERKNDSLEKVMSNFKDVLIEKERERLEWERGKSVIDSATNTTRHNIKQIIKKSK